MTLTDRRVLGSVEAVHDGAVEFYQDLLTTSSVQFDEEALGLLTLLC